MTKSTSPTANAGLPAIDRRSVVCGLGTAAVAGVPALASAVPMSDDPVFQAMAALEQLMEETGGDQFDLLRWLETELERVASLLAD